MPVYDYKCRKCGIETEVIRTIHQTDVSPTSDETPSPKPDQERCEEHDWEKLIKGKTTVIRGPNWGYGSKGNW